MSVLDVNSATESAETGGETRLAGIGLEQTRQAVDATLEAIEAERGEARRLITRELGFEPGAEMLRTVVDIALDRDATGDRRELPRQLLAVRVMSDRELRDLLEAEPLAPERITDSRKALGQVFEATQRLEARVREAIVEMRDAERDRLLQITDCLIPHQEKLRSARILAQRLELLARAAHGGELIRTVPSLTSAEAHLVETAATLSSEDGGCCRVRLDATAVRTLLQEDMEAWKQLSSFLGSNRRELRVATLSRRMANHRDAYRFVSRRLQFSLDEAVQAELTDFAEELRDTHRDLYATYLEFAPLLDHAERLTLAAAPGTIDRPAEDTPGISRRGLLGVVDRLTRWSR